MAAIFRQRGEGVMNKSITGALTGLWLLAAPLCGLAAGEDAPSLAQQVQVLSARVQALEARLQRLEEKGGAAAVPPPATSRAPGPWERLTIGMSPKKVRRLLGEPVAQSKGAVEHWYYSDARLAGPYVTFTFGLVQSWQAPPDGATNHY
ncbi:MAG TPA: outer membrane protein assembly factor BamE [Gammaproteobacteria bacterium]|nr:outer membrane protein assembly factor BamE [Gammaproteobacteria bacterium]